jgi:malate dehydrogenase (oxaloacetate-decarboxylating)
LGILVAGARRVTDGMIMAAAKTLASLSPAAGDDNAPLLPPVGDSRKIGLRVAEAVAKQAAVEDVCGLNNASSLEEQLRAYVWEPVYRAYERVDYTG